MPRYRLLIEYDGTPFVGWQRLPEMKTVQGALEDAVVKVQGSPAQVYGAGRTDSGVHATGQTAHVDMDFNYPRKVADALNAHLRPAPIAVLKAVPVHDEWHARFSARQRHYRYIIFNRRAHLTVEAMRAWQMPMPLDTDLMDREAKMFLGRHDFSTFRDSACQAKSPVRTVDKVDVARFEDRVEITVSAQSFLHRQVRSMVGSLVDVGRGLVKPGFIEEILAAADRTACGQVAPAHGLYLERVDYEDDGRAV